MNISAPLDINDVREFVLQHETDGRVWPVGSPNGFASWLFLQRASLETSQLQHLAGDYVLDVIDSVAALEAYPDGRLANEAAALQLELIAVNRARHAVADLVSVARLSSHGYDLWESISEMATSNIAVEYVDISDPHCLRLLRSTLDMLAHFVRPLVAAGGDYQPASNSDGELDRTVFSGLMRLDETLREEPEWDARRPYLRIEFAALVRLADDQQFATAIQHKLNAAEC